MATLAASGSLTAAWNGTGIAPAGSVVQLTTADATSVGVEITGTFVLTAVLEATMDGSTWFAVNPFSIAGVGVSATITAPGRCTASVADFVQVRARCSAFTSGAAVVTMDGSAAAGGGGGSGGGGGGGAVTVADGADTALGTTTDAGIITNIAGTAIGFLRGGIIQWAAFLARFPAALGGTTAANSLPVALSSDGQFVTSTGSLTETAPATDTASSGLNGRLQRVAQRLSSLIALLPAALGSTTAANSLGVTLSTDGQFVTSTGSLTETAPATDTASSGLNGRLQRVAQRLTSLIALLPTALISNRLDVNLGAAPAAVTIGTNAALVTGSATIGAVTQASGPWTVQGAGAAAAALAGNPVRVGISDGSNTQDWKQATASTGPTAATGIPAVALNLFNSSNSQWVNAAAASADGVNATNSLVAVPGLFNGGTTIDRARNNVDATLLASAARTTTQPGSNITAYNCQAIAVTVDVTLLPGSAISNVVTIGYVDPASGKVITLLTGAAIVGVGTTMYLVDPRVVAAANLVAQKPIGRVFVINVTAGNSNSATYSVGYTLIPC